MANESIPDIINRNSTERCTLEEAESLIQNLKSIDPLLNDSDAMLQLEDIVKTRRRAQEIKSEVGNKLTRDQLIRLVERSVYVVENNLSVDEYDALQKVFVDSVSLPGPAAIALFSRAGEDMTPTQVVDQAFSFQAIQL